MLLAYEEWVQTSCNFQTSSSSQEVDLPPVEELEVVEFEHGKTVTIGRDLKASLREEVINCLSRNIDVFA